MKTQRIKLILFLIGLIIITSREVQAKKQYIIQGSIIGIPDNAILSLITTSNDDNPDTIQTTKSKDDKFIFDLQNLVEGKAYFIILDISNEISGIPNGTQNWILLIPDNECSIKISGTLRDWPSVDIIGSNATNIHADYQKRNNKYVEQINHLFPQLPADLRLKTICEIVEVVKNDTSALLRDFLRISEDWRNYVLGYTNMNMNSPVAPLFIIKSSILSLNEKRNVYDGLPSQTKNSFYGKQLKEYLANEMVRSKNMIGTRIPDFNLTTPEGKVVSIRELVGKSKLTLIDFWASWCSPCRDAIPHLKEVYSRFKARGFNIVGVVTSKNDKEEVWKKALIIDKTPWNQGMDMTNVTDTFFPKDGIPSYILVDGSGKLIATSLTTFNGKGEQGPKITGSEFSKTLDDLLDVK